MEKHCNVLVQNLIYRYYVRQYPLPILRTVVLLQYVYYLFDIPISFWDIPLPTIMQNIVLELSHFLFDITITCWRCPFAVGDKTSFSDRICYPFHIPTLCRNYSPHISHKRCVLWSIRCLFIASSWCRTVFFVGWVQQNSVWKYPLLIWCTKCG